MLYWLSSYCIMTIMIIVYKMMALLMAYCTCTALLFFLFFVCTLIVFVDNLFFLLGQPVSELYGFSGSPPIVWLFL